MAKNPEKVQIGLLFCANQTADLDIAGLDAFNCSNLEFGNYTFPNSYPYLIIMNRTDGTKNMFMDLTVPMPKDPIAFALKVKTD